MLGKEMAEGLIQTNLQKEGGEGKASVAVVTSKFQMERV